MRKEKILRLIDSSLDLADLKLKILEEYSENGSEHDLTYCYDPNINSFTYLENKIVIERQFCIPINKEIKDEFKNYIKNCSDHRISSFYYLYLGNNLFIKHFINKNNFIYYSLEGKKGKISIGENIKNIVPNLKTIDDILNFIENIKTNDVVHNGLNTYYKYNDYIVNYSIERKSDEDNTIKYISIGFFEKVNPELEELLINGFFINQNFYHYKDDKLFLEIFNKILNKICY